MVKEKLQTVSNTLVFFVNGRKIEDTYVDPEWTLLYYLRNKLRLCGVKLGCGEGGCGACTVMVSRYDRKKGRENHIPVNACLAPICSMHGLAVTTVEGIGSTKTKLHPVQERIAKAHGSQCGFCTPGIVMSMYTLLRNSPRPSMKDLEIAFQGNLCRCTGYRPIIEGFKTFTEEWELVQNGKKLANETNGVCGMGDQCCKLKNGSKDENNEVRLFKTGEFTPYHPSQEPIFPPELKICNQYDQEYLIIKGQNVTWYRPTELHELLSLKGVFPNAKIVVGNTEIGVETKFKNMVYPVIIQPLQIEELTTISENDKGVRVGASVTLIELEEFLKRQIGKYPEYKTRFFKQIVDMLNWFAGKQIRSVGALGSNIMTGSPISDMVPLMMAAKVQLEVQSKVNGLRKITLDENFFTGYRKNIIQPDEILLNIVLPYTSEYQYFQAYKQARRREDDIAIVNMAVNVNFEGETHIISEISFGFGGMSFKTVNAPQTQRKLKGLPWTRETLEIAFNCLLEDLPLDPSAPGGMVQYRRSLSLSLFFKAYLAISAKLQNLIPEVKIDDREITGIHGFHGKVYKSSQYFTVAPKTQEKHDAVQRPLVHRSAFKQATGEAVYCDDLPHFENELFMAFVTSTKAHANILSIDPSKALAIKGVHGFVSANDLDKDRNQWGAEFKEELFFYDKVTSQEQIIGAIVAKDHITAQRAAKQVAIEYEELEPLILSIEDAIKHKSFYKDPFVVMEKGNVKSALETSPHVIEGQCRMGGQEHFYFETQGCIAVPKPEDDEIEIYSSTQSPTEVATAIAETLNINQNKVTVKVKRIGGGFGGKQSRATALATAAAVAAKKFNRPIRCSLDRDQDMAITGGRHPFLMKYKAGFDDNGKILGGEFELYTNGGYSIDLTFAVLEKAMITCENAYHIPAMKITGYPCKTNLPSNTAFRGFGSPQGMFVGENLAHDIADYLKKDTLEVSEINLYKEGDSTIYNQKLVNCTLDKCWKECIISSDYYARRKQVYEFNRKNRFKKRGLSLIPTKYGISFEVDFLNQGAALVLVYADGSVLLYHGGVEMGQGLYTKMIQVASRALGVSVEKIHTSETGTDTVPNTTPTAASTGSDLNGMAVLDACTIIKERLRPYKEANPNGTWEEWVKKAYFDRVSLSATGFYKTPGIGHDYKTGEGDMFAYYTYGVGCSEVEIDTLTGDHQIVRTDIVMDLGESLNPAIDIGQIEGAFMQGYGLFVLEELMYSPTGAIYTKGPGTYKVPGFADIPGEFNVSLLKGVSNPRAVYSSKAVGEPPLFLSSSVFFAIKDAIKAARKENGVSTSFKLTAPATAEKIRMACEDNITDKIEQPEPGTFTPWNIVP